MLEMAIGIAILGILTTVAVPSVHRKIVKAQTAEASGHIAKMWAGSIAYYEADHSTALGVPLSKMFPVSANTSGTSAEATCCSFPGGKCPGGSIVYAKATWVALAFGIADGHRYSPRYISSGTGGTSKFTAQVQGDLDCDKILGVYERTGIINGNGDVVGQSPIIIKNETE